jgi:hypothetical protein
MKVIVRACLVVVIAVLGKRPGAGLGASRAAKQLAAAPTRPRLTASPPRTPPPRTYVAALYFPGTSSVISAYWRRRC